MKRRWRVGLVGAVLCGAVAAGCGGAGGDNPIGAPDGAPGRDGAARGDAVGPTACAPGDDTDGDGIPDRIDGTSDVDGDSVPNLRDPDSDGDGRTDGLEANAGRPFDCSRQTALDSDMDGLPDFLDTDSDGNGVPDAAEFAGATDARAPEGGWPAQPADADRDMTPNYADVDDDNDQINDVHEIAPGTPEAPADTDRDGTPDFRDTDSDGDTIRDADEGALDQDGDYLPNFRDDDADGDGLGDRDEAGDADLATPPTECARELDSSTLNLAMPMPDTVRDFRDTDSDNDGLSDREEVANHTDRCDPDSDRDGQLDSAEVVWCQRNRRTNCATDMGTTIPPTDYYLILPNGGPLVPRELEFGTNLRVADVFFIFDTTGSMSAVQQGVANSIAAPNVGMIDSIRRVIPDTYFGVGHYDDFPTGGFGGGSDRALHALCDGPPGSHPTPECAPGRSTYGGITMQPAMRAADVQAGALAIPGGGGNDGPESSVEALYQLVTNEGLYDRSAPGACSRGVGTAPCWVRPTTCDEGTWGYPCFRDGALAIVVHYADAPYHNGARDESPPTTSFHEPYSGISPAPHNFDEMVAAYQRRRARQINVAAGQRCEGRLFTNHSEYGPCYDMRRTAEATSSVDLDGNPLIYDLPPGVNASTPPTELVAQVAGAVETLATRMPLDINTAMRNDAMNPNAVDATRFIKRRVPSCRAAMPTNNRCWTEPAGITHSAAVANTDLSTFYRVVPGTRVRFTIYFQNDGVYRGSEAGVTLFHAYIDVLGDGVTRLDEREVFILVPAFQPPVG